MRIGGGLGAGGIGGEGGERAHEPGGAIDKGENVSGFREIGPAGGIGEAGGGAAGKFQRHFMRAGGGAGSAGVRL